MPNDADEDDIQVLSAKYAYGMQTQYMVGANGISPINAATALMLVWLDLIEQTGGPGTVVALLREMANSYEAGRLGGPLKQPNVAETGRA